MKLKVLLVVLFVSVLNINAQDYFPDNDKCKGKYYSMNKFGDANEVFLQFGKPGSSRLMALSLTEKGFPSLFYFKEEASKRLKQAIFLARLSMVFRYDENSYVMVFEQYEDGKAQPDTVVHFLSKDKSKVASMTDEKALEYAMNYAGEL